MTSLSVRAELKTLGADVVKADLDDVESLIQAFRGAHGVYGNTGMSLGHSSMLPMLRGS